MHCSDLAQGGDGFGGVGLPRFGQEVAEAKPTKAAEGYLGTEDGSDKGSL